MADEKRNWRDFQKIKFSKKHLTRRAKKAEGATVRHARKFIVGRLESIRESRRHIIGWLLLVTVLVAVVGVQLVWFQQSYQTVAASDGGTYAEATLGPIETLNPLYASSSAEISSSHLLFSSLYDYDQKGVLHADLADRVDIDSAGTTYTVKLKSGVKWHDGAALTANDVAFTINLIKQPETRSSLRANWQDVTVQAIDDTTLVFKLPAVHAAFKDALTFSVLPEHVLGKIAPGAIRENAFSRSPIGSGPFKLRLLQTADTGNKHKIIHMVAFEDYFKGQPKLARFELHAFDTPALILDALKTGEVNAASDISTGDINSVSKVNYTIKSQTIDSGVYAILNTTQPLLKDKTVRQALQLATNTGEIRNGLNTPVPSLELPFINGQLTGNDLPKVPAADTKRAGDILDAAGWKLVGSVREKGGQKLSLQVVTTKDAEYENVLQMLATQWRAIGVEVITKVVDSSDPAQNFVQDVLQPRQYDVLIYQLAIGADPDVYSYAYWHSSQVGQRGYNFSNYSSITSDDALVSASLRLEPELRNAKYKAFAKQWVEDVPAIALYQSTVQYVQGQGVSSVGDNAVLVSPYDRYSNVLYWSVNQQTVYKTP
ncbi:MAG: peptide ABC transporter substrate-binding protein [Candidatus Saccharimonadales bacterium]